MACGAGLSASARPAQAQLPPARARVTADSALLMGHLGYLASDEMEGRAPGSSGSARARAFLVRELKATGARPFRESFEAPFDPTDGGSSGGGVNVVGWLPGTRADAQWMVVTAHYDHLGVRGGEVYNGADDNASGSAALLFLARAVARRPLDHPVIFAALDAEEAGLVGARSWLADSPVPLRTLALDLNLDMLARGDGMLWAAGAYHHPWLGPVLDRIAGSAPMTLRQGHDRPGVPGQADWSWSSDHGAFHDRDIPWVYLGVEDHPDVHRPTDDVERIEPSDYLDAVATALLALEALDRALPLHADADRPTPRGTP